MPMGEMPLVPAAATKTLACIDTKDFFGILYNPYLKSPASFRGLIDLMNELEGLFNHLSFPMAFFGERTFDSVKQPQAEDKKKEVRKYMDDDILFGERGQKATFMIQVHFRQNATWQGTIVWIEEKKKRSFRSALEMIRLMDQVVTSDSETQKW